MLRQITKSELIVERGIGWRVTVTEIRLFGWLPLYRHTCTEQRQH